MRIAEVAARLGVCNTTVYRWIREGRITTIGNPMRISTEEFEKLLESGLPPKLPESDDELEPGVTYITVEEAAHQTGMSRDSIYSRGRIGRLGIKRIKGKYFVPATLTRAAIHHDNQLANGYIHPNKALISLAELSKELGVSSDFIRKRCIDEGLKIEKVGSRWWVDRRIAKVAGLSRYESLVERYKKRGYVSLIEMSERVGISRPALIWRIQQGYLPGAIRVQSLSGKRCHVFVPTSYFAFLFDDRFLEAHMKWCGIDEKKLCRDTGLTTKQLKDAIADRINDDVAEVLAEYFDTEPSFWTNQRLRTKSWTRKKSETPLKS